ncbi:MAG: hypothetical protein OEL78_07135 [Hyphomicrobiales bacterium]|nr:hypothetical protein [Hyphomicrobiales bacterium]
MSDSPTLLGSCAKAATAAEARFRVDYPNSRQRASRIIALDETSAAVMRRIAAAPWKGAHFLTYVSKTVGAKGLDSLPVDASLKDDGGGEVRLSGELEGANVVVMIAAAGGAWDGAAVIGNACLVRGIMTTGLIVASGGERAQVARGVAALRPYAAMLVVSTGEKYIPEMLTALRA